MIVNHSTTWFMISLIVEGGGLSCQFNDNGVIVASTGGQMLVFACCALCWLLDLLLRRWIAPWIPPLILLQPDRSHRQSGCGWRSTTSPTLLARSTTSVWIQLFSPPLCSSIKGDHRVQENLLCWGVHLVVHHGHLRSFSAVLDIWRSSHGQDMATPWDTLAVNINPHPSVALVKAAKRCQHHGSNSVWSLSTASRTKALVQSRARNATQIYMPWRNDN